MKFYLLPLISNKQQKPIILSKFFYMLSFVRLNAMHNECSIEREKYTKKNTPYISVCCPQSSASNFITLHQ